ncbi:unnamed protein product [Lactuca virosa]|uniref:Pentatricopeptide repeat-containing protein n=1 Tax=Lactuca virosa TaxID=75947 RepID=A0AAU9MYP6_9ASTR|nr:unnamed protein product [Lactuca virosa]
MQNWFSAVDGDSGGYNSLPKTLSSSFSSLLAAWNSYAATKGSDVGSSSLVGNGLITMYGKCNRLLEGHHVFDEMPSRDIIFWNAIVASYTQNRMFDDALEICKTMMQCSTLKPNACPMASLSPAVTTSTSSTNVMFMKEMFMNHARESLISWNRISRLIVASVVDSSFDRRRRRRRTKRNFVDEQFKKQCWIILVGLYQQR